MKRAVAAPSPRLSLLRCGAAHGGAALFGTALFGTALLGTALGGATLGACAGPRSGEAPRSAGGVNLGGAGREGVRGTEHAKAAQSSGTALERYFPLVARNVYQYDVEGGDGASGTMTVRAGRSDATHGELHVPSGVRSFEYREDRVVVATASGVSATVLALPIAVGSEWRGEHGRVVVRAVELSVELPAGSQAGCIETLESRGGDVPIAIATTYCPGVGMVRLEATSGERTERITLRSYGPPVELGPDGLSVTREREE